MLEVNITELSNLVEEEASVLGNCPFYSASKTVIGEVNGQIVVLTVMSKATACDAFDGDDYYNLNLITEREDS